jgi:peptidoglycan hydrolase CwlO-like protein
MSIAARMMLVVVGIIAIGVGVYAGYRTYERDHRASHIRSEQQDLQKRIDALSSEMQTSTSDPATIKSRRERLDALQKDLDAIKRE